MIKDKQYWIAFTHIPSLGPRKLKLLYEHFPNMEGAWRASAHELRSAGLTARDIKIIIEQRRNINPAACWEIIQHYNIRAITIREAKYPQPLKQLYDPPAVLYVRGEMPDDWQFALAIVGTRKTTPYGRQITPDIVVPLARAGLTIVSGLALGIDTLAHQSTLDAHGKTVAVLANGLDSIYPRSNHRLGQTIISQGGALISEYPPNVAPLKQHFPVRNRIISGLSRGVVVIEGSADSGSLITARSAIEQNRDVFAIPGNISSSTAWGPNNLIKMGATMVTDAQDIFEALEVAQTNQYKESKKIIPDSPAEKKLLDYFSREPVQIDEIMQKCKLTTSTINATLVTMEMKGLIRHCGAGRYILTT